MEEIVPESIYRSPPYSPKQQDKSEGLLEGAVDLLNASYRRMKVGGLKPVYYIELGYPASYAKHVDKMRNVKWSKAGSRGDFYCLSKRFLIRNFRTILKLELQKQKAVTQSLEKYIGVSEDGS